MIKEAAERQAIRDLAANDLYFFTRYMHSRRKGSLWLRSPHHEAICNALIKVFNGEITRLIINVPPRYSKTELAVINFSAWCYGQYPDCEFIHTSYSGGLATNNSFQVRELIQSDEYRVIFPNTVIRTDSKAKNEWRTTEGGLFYAVGSEGTITGYGAGKRRDEFGGAIIIDDPHKADEAKSPTIRKNVIDWFMTTLENRKNAPHTPIILIMQRLHVEDLTGFLLNGGNGERWDHLCLPALSEDGKSALWDSMHTVEALETMRRANSYNFAGQYQQNPIIVGGNHIKGEWFGRWAILPKIKEWAIFADTAQKTKEHNDYSVFELWGKGEDGRAYLVDLIRGKWESPDLKRKVTDFWDKHADKGVRRFWVEDKSSGSGLIQEIKRATRIPIFGINRHTDRWNRIQDALPHIECGNVMLPASAPWVSDFVAECEAFTADDSHTHDDQIDPMCDAIKEFLQSAKTRGFFS